MGRQAKLRQERKQCVRSSKTNKGFSSCSVGDIAKKVYELHGRGCFIFALEKPLVYVLASSAFLYNETDSFLLGTYNPETEHVISVPLPCSLFATRIFQNNNKEYIVSGDPEFVVKNLIVMD